MISQSPSASTMRPSPSPTASHADPAPEVLIRLEQLDDTIFAAIEADADALDRAAGSWNKALRELGREVLEESRQQYLRYARSEWQRLCNQRELQPHKTVAVLEIMSLLG